MADGLQTTAVRSLDAAALFSQSVLAGEVNARQRERELASERAARQDLVEGLAGSAGSESVDMDLSRREMDAREGLARRYKVVWKAGKGATAVAEITHGPPSGGRIDLSA